MNTNKKLLLIPLALIALSVFVSASSVQTALFYDSTNSSSLSIMNGQNVGVIIDANSILENSMTINVSLLDSSGKVVSNLVNVYTTNNTYSNYIIFGQGTYLSSGNYTIVSNVVAASGQTATDKLYLQVLPVPPQNSVPVITSTPVTQINSSQLYNYQVVATDADGDVLTYSLTQAPQLPAWLSINSSTGLLSGTAPSVSADTNYTLNISVSDGVNAPVSQVYTLTVLSVSGPGGSSAGGPGTMAGNAVHQDLSYETQQYLNQFAPKSVVAEEPNTTQTSGSSALFWVILGIIILIILLALIVFLLRRNKK